MLVLGINHKTAPLALREKVAFHPEQLSQALEHLATELDVNEAVIVSTCNRTEIYTVLDQTGHDQLVSWLHTYHQLPETILTEYVYSYEGEHAVRHLMRVASGLDSLVLGEPQILGQLKQAYQGSKQVNMVGFRLERLLQQAFSVAKKVRTDTAIGSSAVSVAYAAVSLAKHIFSDLAEAQALLVGAGETTELVARHLYNQGMRRMIVANRTVERAQELAQVLSAQAVSLTDIPQYLHHCDIVVSSTASPLPIIGKGMVESALVKRRHDPIFMVDLAVPRDIEQEVGELGDIYLYTVDDLQHVITENMRAREEAAGVAEDIIAVQANKFMQWLRSLDAVTTIRAYREKYQTICHDELQEALKQIANGELAEDVLCRFANRLTNKFLHAPSTQLREASAQGKADILSIAGQLFDLQQQAVKKQSQLG